MNIEFELSNKQEVLIKNNNKVIGRIFTPAGTLRDVPNAIQVCGFDFAYQLYGCGVITGDDKLHKKDIQLLFQLRKEDYYKIPHENFECWKCFNSKENCSCDELKIFKDIESVEKFMGDREKSRLKKEILDNLKE